METTKTYSHSHSGQTLVGMFLSMSRIRKFEEAVAKLAAEGLTRGPIHQYIGEEAVAVGACTALEPTDYVLSTHRGHGHNIAKDANLNRMMAELLGREEGLCKGRGGSMHLADIERGLLSCSGIVAGSIPIALGAGFSAKYKKSGQVTVSFFGDGASNTGACHESLNLAAVWKLPVVFVCENNLYGLTCAARFSLPIEDIADRSVGYGIPGIIVDGMDVRAVYNTVKEAIDRARSGNGPSLIECKTYRFTGHWHADPVLYRTQEEVEQWKQRDPIKLFREALIEENVLTLSELDRLEAQVTEEVAAAVAFAKAGTHPSTDSVSEFTYA